MCVVSMIGDHYADKWRLNPPLGQQIGTSINITNVTREEFDKLKYEVENLKELLRRAKEYDQKNGEPDCTMEEKIVLLRQVAKLVGVDLNEVLPAIKNI